MSLHSFTEASGIAAAVQYNCSFFENTSMATCSLFWSQSANGTVSSTTMNYTSRAVDRTLPITGNTLAFLQATQTCNTAPTIVQSSSAPAPSASYVSEKELSTGSKAGIGLAVVTIAFVALGVLLLYRRGKGRRASEEAHLHDDQENEDPPPKYHATGKDGKKADNYALYELESPMVPLEMPTARDPVEVEAQEVDLSLETPTKMLASQQQTPSRRYDHQCRQRLQRCRNECGEKVMVELHRSCYFGKNQTTSDSCSLAWSLIFEAGWMSTLELFVPFSKCHAMRRPSYPV